MKVQQRYLISLSLFVLFCLSFVGASTQTPPTTDIKDAKKSETFHFFIFSERCFKLFTEEHNYYDIPCLKLTLSKIVGFAMVYLSILLKVPQIIKILGSRSSEGLSYTGFFVELLTYTFSIGYNLHYKNPFSTYGENVFLTMQGIIILFLIKFYDKKLGFGKFWVSQVFYAVFTTVLLLDLIPEEVHKVSMLISIVLLYCARIPQILLNFKNKSTGQLSFLTTFVSWGGCIARTLTILVEVPDDMILIALMLSATLLNGIIVLQFLIYWNSQAKKSHKE